jgi:uncharacterized protein
VAHLALISDAPTQPTPRQRLAEIGLGAAFLVGLAAALQIVELVLGKSPLAAAIAGAVVADIVAGRAGVRWDSSPPAAPHKAPGAPPAGANEKTAAKPQSDDKPRSASDPAPTEIQPAPVRHTAIGMAAALVAMVITLTLGALLGWVQIDAGGPSASLGFGILRATAIGVRDELMLRGIILTAASRARLNPLIGASVAALAGGASLALIPAVSLGAVALAITSGFFFALLWQRFQGAWAAVGASAFWAFLIGTATRGGILDVTWTSGSLVSSGRSTAGAAYLAAAVFALLSGAMLLYSRRRPRPSRP